MELNVAPVEKENLTIKCSSRQFVKCKISFPSIQKVLTVFGLHYKKMVLNVDDVLGRVWYSPADLHPHTRYVFMQNL